MGDTLKVEWAPPTVPSLIVSELPTLHQPHHQTLSGPHDDLTAGPIKVLLPAPGVQ